MREILFRGKRIIGGEWMYGSLLTDNRGQKHIIPFREIYMDGHHVCIESDWPQFFDQQTIGQFTGLTDKNGKMIFEGDKIKLTQGIGTVEWFKTQSRFMIWLPKNNEFVRFLAGIDYEVIGNIHEGATPCTSATVE